MKRYSLEVGCETEDASVAAMTRLASMLAQVAESEEGVTVMKCEVWRFDDDDGDYEPEPIHSVPAEGWEKIR